MRLDPTDRSRLVLASVLTAVALPAVWWANADDAAVNRPNVAAAGLAADDAAPTAAVITEPAIIEPAYLTPASTISPPPPPSVQVGVRDYTVVGSLPATFRRDVGRQTCEVAGLDVARVVTVVNPANGQSVECSTVESGSDEPSIVFALDTFAVLADFTDAPVTVEIRE